MDGTTFVIGRDAIPDSLYVEGFNPGQATLKASLLDDGGAEQASSEVMFTVIQVQIQKPERDKHQSFLAESDFNSSGPIDFQASVLPTSMNQLPISWALHLEYQTDGGGPFTVDKQGTTTNGQVMQQTFTSMGGKLTIKAGVKVHANDCSSSITNYIVGVDVPVAMIKARLTNAYTFMPTGGTPNLLVGLPYSESTWRQFGMDTLYGTDDLWPLQNYQTSNAAHGAYIGIMQVPVAMNTAWDWMVNVDMGVQIFHDKLNYASQRENDLRTQHPDLPALTGEQLENDALGFYQGGRNYPYNVPVEANGHWQWQDTAVQGVLDYVSGIRGHMQ